MITVCRGRHLLEVEKWWSELVNLLDKKIMILELPVSMINDCRGLGIYNEEFGPIEELKSLPETGGPYFIIHAMTQRQLLGLDGLRDRLSGHNFHVVHGPNQDVSSFSGALTSPQPMPDMEKEFNKAFGLGFDSMSPYIEYLTWNIHIILMMERKNAFYVEAHTNNEHEYNPESLTAFFNDLVF